VDDFKEACIKSNCTRAVIIKEGHNNGLIAPSNIKSIILCIFTTNEPHGDVYAKIGKSYGNKDIPIIPHICCLPDKTKDELWQTNRPRIVIGRYGGLETFNIKFVQETVLEYASKGIVFIFMNTNVFANHKNIIYLKGTSNAIEKQKFINSCDIMLHAREEGETYGLSCGEFILSGKMVMTYKHSKDKEHIILGGLNCIEYYNKQSLCLLLDALIITGPPVKNWECEYNKNTPNAIMSILNKYIK